MAYRRQRGDDYTYGEEHRNHLRELYTRVGHRLDMADRDWTEFCHYCKRPLELYEMVRDVGQNLADKGVSVTRNLSRASRLPSKLVAYRVSRPQEVDDLIDALNRKIINMEVVHRIEGFTIRHINPVPVGPAEVILRPDEWWEYLAMIHAGHWYVCPSAQLAKETKGDYVPDELLLRRRWARHPLGGSLFFPGEQTGTDYRRGFWRA